MFGKKQKGEKNSEISNVSETQKASKNIKSILSSPITLKKNTDKKESPKSKSSGKPKALYKKKGNHFVAVDFGSRSIKFAVGNYNGGRIKVEKLFKAELPSELYGDGVISDEKKLMDIIKQEMTKQKVKDVDIVVSLDSTSIIRRNMTIPALNELETRELIGFEFEEYLGINQEDYIIQHKVLQEYEKDGRKREIQLDAVPRALAKKVFNIFKQGGFNPCILDVQSNYIEALGKICDINGEAVSKNRTVAIADIGNHGILINIFKDGNNVFNRIIADTNSIGRELSTELNWDNTSVSRFLNGFRDKSVLSVNPNDVADDHVLDLIKSCIDRWAIEIDKMLSYYRSRSIDNKIDKLYIYGGDSILKDVDQYIEKRIAVPTETIRTFSNLDMAKSVDTSDIPIYVNSIGALIRG